MTASEQLVAVARETCGPDQRAAIRALIDAIHAIAGTCERPEIELAIVIGQLQAVRLRHVAAGAGASVVKPFSMETSDQIDTAPMRRIEREE